MGGEVLTVLKSIPADDERMVFPNKSWLPIVQNSLDNDNVKVVAVINRLRSEKGCVDKRKEK